ncbi:hypothetical protein ES703_60109 [subsurface metagenome]
MILILKKVFINDKKSKDTCKNLYWLSMQKTQKRND